MAKFSVSRDGEDDDCDYDEEDVRASTPEPKRWRRLSGGGTSSSSSSLPNTYTVVASSKTYLDRREDGSVNREDGFPREEIDLVYDRRGDAEDQTSADGSISVILADPDVLDCPVCFDPLTTPVYQCENGHVACSSCCINIKNKCPSCSERIGYNRCRGIEKVLESVKIQCSYNLYGCQTKVSYCNKLSHEETCPCAPYSCPFRICSFRGCSKRLALHLGQRHGNSVIQFRFNSTHPLSFGTVDKLLVLQEERSGALFVLNVGDKMAVKLITRPPGFLKTRFPYGFVVRRGGSSLRFQSFTEENPAGLVSSDSDDDPPSADFCPVPSYFFNSSGRLKFEFCIWSSNIEQGMSIDVSGTLAGVEPD